MTDQTHATEPPRQVKEDFGARLRELRRRRKWTQEHLAERADLAADTVRRLEMATFNPSLLTLTKLADGLGISTAALLDDDYDQVDDLAVLIRGLPEPQQRVAFAVVYTLHYDATVGGRQLP